MRSAVSAFALFFVISAPLAAQTLRVRHDHDPWGGCEGTLEITTDGIRYTPDEGDHGRDWAWLDIQSVDRRSPERFSVLTYEDLSWHLGLDRAFDFTVLPGGDSLSDALFERIRNNVPRPVTDRVPMPLDPEYQLPVKHLHLLGGCEGTLMFSRDWVVYATDDENDARTWRRSEIASVWSSNPYELELRVLEEDRRAFDKVKRFSFQLKEPIDADYYEKLRREFLVAR